MSYLILLFLPSSDHSLEDMPIPSEIKKKRFKMTAFVHAL